MTRAYSDFRYWSGVHDRDMARVSIGDGKGGEFYMVIPDDGGRRYREARAQAMSDICEAMDLGLAPGCVRVNQGVAA